MKLGQSVRSLLPESIQAKVPAQSEHGAWPTRAHARKVLMLAGCVQPAMLPNINYATARVLDAVGMQTVIVHQGRVLRRGEVPPQRPGRRQGPDARQYRCMVASVQRAGSRPLSAMPRAAARWSKTGATLLRL